MFLLRFLILIAFLFVIALKGVSFLISEKALLSREECRSFECGFEHHNVSRVPFSLRYFFLTLIFLLFDLEIVLIIFVPFMIFSVRYLLTMLILLVFIVILYLALVYEWNDGRLEWVI